MKIFCLTFFLLFLAGCSWTGYTLVDREALKVQAKYTETYVTESNKLWAEIKNETAIEMQGIGVRLVRNIKAMAGEEKK